MPYGTLRVLFVKNGAKRTRAAEIIGGRESAIPGAARDLTIAGNMGKLQENRAVLAIITSGRHPLGFNNDEGARK